EEMDRFGERLSDEGARIGEDDVHEVRELRKPRRQRDQRLHGSAPDEEVIAAVIARQALLEHARGRFDRKLAEERDRLRLHPDVLPRLKRRAVDVLKGRLVDAGLAVRGRQSSQRPRERTKRRGDDPHVAVVREKRFDERFEADAGPDGAFLRRIGRLADDEGGERSEATEIERQVTLRFAQAPREAVLDRVRAEPARERSAVSSSVGAGSSEVGPEREDDLVSILVARRLRERDVELRLAPAELVEALARLADQVLEMAKPTEREKAKLVVTIGLARQHAYAPLFRKTARDAGQEPRVDLPLVGREPELEERGGRLVLDAGRISRRGRTLSFAKELDHV